MSDRWRVIRTGTMIPGLDQWTIFDERRGGPPNSYDLSGQDGELAYRVAILLNREQARVDALAPYRPEGTEP